MATAPRYFIPLRQVKWRLVLGLIAVVTICLFFYRQLDYVANGTDRPPLLTFLEEAIGGMAGFAVFPLMYLVAIRFPLLSPAWRRNLLIHLGSLCVISVIHTSLIATLREALFPLFGFHNDYGYLPVRYPMEFAHLFIFYWVGVSLVYLFHEIRFRRERELREARLETNLAEAQLENLRLQLEPHFLFNALNAISAAIYEDPRVADEMVGRLSELLRQLLRSERSQQVSLAREIEFLQLYTRMMEARFEHRLRISLSFDEEVEEALVPQLILQPLVENAIRHGMDPVTFSIEIAIEAHREQDSVAITIRDHGPGLDPALSFEEGIGLRNTRERLEKLYGERQSFAIRNAEGGGARVEIRLPFQAASVCSRQSAKQSVSA